jgi:hypothetical protein
MAPIPEPGDTRVGVSRIVPEASGRFTQLQTEWRIFTMWIGMTDTKIGDSATKSLSDIGVGTHGE